MRQAQEEFRQVTDPVAIWLARKTVETPEAMVSKDELLQAYNADGERLDRSPMTPTAFGLAIHRLRPLLQEGQRAWKGQPKARVWIGLGLKSA
jgi:hypothetical protein